MAPEAVTFRCRKYGGELHRTWRAFGTLRAHGFLVFGYGETTMEYPATQRRISFEEMAVHLVQPGVGRLVTMWYSKASELEGIYVDVCLPPEFDRQEMTLDFIDLDLDVRVRPGHAGAVPDVLDRDEYERHARERHYPLALRAFAEGSLRAILEDIGSGHPPFDRPAADWLVLLQEILRAAPPSPAT